MWLQNFGYTAAANRTLNSMLAFMYNIPNWAYNGGSRSLGDLGNNGEAAPRLVAPDRCGRARPTSPPMGASSAGLWFINRGNELLLQHYRAGLNAIPLMEGFEYNPGASPSMRASLAPTLCLT